MAIALANVATTDTFQIWLNATNTLATNLRDSIITANTTLGTTIGNAAVAGNLGATTLFANSALRGGNNSTSSTLNITSNAVFSGTANVAGVVNFASAVNAASLSVTGIANIAGDTTFASTVNVASLGVSGAVNFTGAFTAANLTTTTNTVTIGSGSYFVSNGNLGVGTNNPGFKLTVSGNASITGPAVFSSSITAANLTTTTNTVTIGTGAYFVSNGNLGIGTATPGFALTVSGNTSVTGPAVFNSSLTSANLTTTTNTVTIGTGAYFVSNGNLGIGTATPGQTLTVNGTAIITTNTFTVGTGSYFITNGNVGIGTAVPAAKLQVEGNFTANGIIRGDATGGEGGQIELNNPGNASTGVFIDVATADLARLFTNRNSSEIRIGQLGGTGGVVTLFTENSERMRVSSSGEVLIAGTADQGAYNLQVNGTGVWGAGVYFNGSDARIKNDITPLTSGLSVVTKLNPVQFRYKESWSKDTNLQPGFIAQDLQAALVDQPYSGGVVQQGSEYMSVAYQTLIPLLTKAIQEQQAQIEDLKARIATLETN